MNNLNMQIFSLTPKNLIDDSVNAEFMTRTVTLTRSLHRYNKDTGDITNAKPLRAMATTVLRSLAGIRTLSTIKGRGRPTTLKALRSARISKSLKRRHFLKKKQRPAVRDGPAPSPMRSRPAFNDAKRPLARVSDDSDVYCIYCGTELERDINWRMYGGTRGGECEKGGTRDGSEKRSDRRAFVCIEHEPLLWKRKSAKPANYCCRLCGDALKGHNWSQAIGTYVCVRCLFEKTTDGDWLVRREPEIGALLVQRAHMLSALVEENEYRVVEQKHLLHLTEANLQDYVVMTLKSLYGIGVDDGSVKVEWSIDRRNRIDVALPSLRLGIELKRYYKRAHASAGRAKKRRDEEYVESVRAQRRRYDDVLNRGKSDGGNDRWKVHLVSPLASVPSSISFESLWRDIERRIRRREQEEGKQ